MNWTKSAFSETFVSESQPDSLCLAFWDWKGKKWHVKRLTHLQDDVSPTKEMNRCDWKDFSRWHHTTCCNIQKTWYLINEPCMQKSLEVFFSMHIYFIAENSKVLFWHDILLIFSDFSCWELVKSYSIETSWASRIKKWKLLSLVTSDMSLFALKCTLVKLRLNFSI